RKGENLNQLHFSPSPWLLYSLLLRCCRWRSWSCWRSRCSCGCRCSRSAWLRWRRSVRLTAEERGRRAICHNRLVWAVGESSVDLSGTRVLGIRDIQIVDVHDPFQLAYSLKEIQHGVVGAVDINGEWNVTVELVIGTRHCRIPANRNSRCCRRVVQDPDEL